MEQHANRRGRRAGPERQEYARRSWVDPRLEVRPSPVHGTGVFAKEPIRRGEVVAVWGGVVMTEEDIKAGRAKPRTTAEIGEGLYLAGEQGDEYQADDFLNHSCDPNLWMEDEVTLVARRDIASDEEVTIDYAMWGSNPNWTECLCESPLCRGRVTPEDWRLPELQERYGEHFSPFIKHRIRATGRSEPERD